MLAHAGIVAKCDIFFIWPELMQWVAWSCASTLEAEVTRFLSIIELRVHDHFSCWQIT